MILLKICWIKEKQNKKDSDVFNDEMVGSL